jgi:hypothetical protein
MEKVLPARDRLRATGRLGAAIPALFGSGLALRNAEAVEWRYGCGAVSERSYK